MVQSIILGLSLSCGLLALLTFATVLLNTLKYNRTKFTFISTWISGFLSIIFWSYFYYLNL